MTVVPVFSFGVIALVGVVVIAAVFFLLYRELHPSRRRSRGAAARTAPEPQRTVVAPSRSVIHS